MPEKSYMRLMIDEVKAQIKGLGVEMAHQVGHPGEPKSTKEQMAGFKDMKPEDWVRMVDEKGLKDTDAFRTEMLRRQAIAEAQRRPL